MTRVLITGVSSGLGRAVATCCVARGFEVFGLSRRPCDIDGVRFVSADLSDHGSIAGKLAELLEGVDALDYVLLNAGVLGAIKDLAETSYDEIRAVMDVNVWANKALIDALLGSTTSAGATSVRRVSQIIGVSSGAAKSGSGGWGGYSISKAALNLLLRVYAGEHPDTHFTALAPGVIETTMIRTILSAPDDPRHEANGRLRAANAEGRIMAPDTAAARLVDALPGLRDRFASGAYADIREM